MSLTGKFSKHSGQGQNDQPEPELETAPDIENHDTPGHVRHVTFIQPNGDREFFNYADLVKAKFEKTNGEIQLAFRTDGISNITLKGRNLLDLFNELSQHIPKKISCTDERYLKTKEETEIVVTEISVKTEPS